ncbi:hypothetical protein PCASD_19180 [Puccinia coronata f. sp. avenae]|uniref:Peroxin domain-containing protein n=1 Tax=Puccinia coronata f. sp. avenae TaxID=200324 RepID=A0A2N5SJE9_9BASI|nr:hypothetical protein PCASD_19180 [Puccinia coronata f. sp. avenae]
MADPESTFYAAECYGDTLSRYLLKRKPSTDSLRARLESIANPTASKHAKQNSTDSHHRSPRLVRISRKILKSKPRDVKEEEHEIKKITRDRVYWHRQQENARRVEQASSTHDQYNTQSTIPTVIQPTTTGFRTKHLALQQINAIKDQIQIIKQDLTHRYPELPSPKSDDWFRQDEELDRHSDLTRSSSSGLIQRKVKRIPVQSRALVERGVGSIQRKIKSIKRKASHSSTISPMEPNTTQSTSNLTHSIGSPDTTHLSQVAAALLSQQGSTHDSTDQPTYHLTGSITEMDETVDHDVNSPSSLISPATLHTTCSPTSTSNPRPGHHLSIVTQGLPHQSGTKRKHQDSVSYVPLRPYLDTATPVSPNYWPKDSSALPQWQSSAMVYLAEDKTGQIDQWVFSSSLIPQASDPTPRSRHSHRLSLDLPPRESSETQRQKSDNESLYHPAFSPTRFSFVGAAAESSSSSSAFCSPFGSTVIQDPQYFVDKQKPSQIILATDVLIEQQGGLSFFGKENFNERFRSQPWQTVKTIRKYNRPGHLDAEYLPDASQVAVVPTPHSTDTFPLPTPEWYCLTEFSIDKQTKPVDANGWEYYDLFSRKWSANRHGCRTFIRRRRWVRVRGKLDSSAVPDPTHIDFPSPRVSPPDQPLCIEAPDTCDPADQDTQQAVIVIIRKQGAEQCITFNTLTVDGGHVLTMDLPGLPSLEVHWDDSALVTENPVFSSQIVADEVLRYFRVMAQQQVGRSVVLPNHQLIVESLKEQMAAINFQRIIKTTASLSDPQKIQLWRYWLESDASSLAPSVATKKPDYEDIWKVVDMHIQEVQDSFVFDVYRLQFMDMLVQLYSQRTCTPMAAGKLRRQRTAPRHKIQAAASRSTPAPGLVRAATVSTVSTPPPAALRPRPRPPTFLRPGHAPAFLDVTNVRLAYWNSLVRLVAHPRPHAPRPTFRFPSGSLIHPRLTAATLARQELLLRYLKSLNKRKRPASAKANQSSPTPLLVS